MKRNGPWRERRLAWEEEAMSDWPWVIASYALTWTVLGIYALWTVRNLRQARSELEAETRRAGGPPEVEP